MKKVAISGYFDPIHVGHLEFIELSKQLGDYLIVIVNNNAQCKLKKGRHFMDEKDRMIIISSIRLPFCPGVFCIIFIKIKNTFRQ